MYTFKHPPPRTYFLSSDVRTFWDPYLLCSPQALNPKAKYARNEMHVITSDICLKIK